MSAREGKTIIINTIYRMTDEREVNAGMGGTSTPPPASRNAFSVLIVVELKVSVK